MSESVSGESVSPEQFKAAMGTFAAGVTVCTTVDPEGRRWGLTATAFSSLSLDPPLCLVCIHKQTGSYEAFKAAGRFAVNVLTDAQEDVSNRFASKVEDKFAETRWEPGPATGSPVFPDALAWFECETHEILAGGDHDVFVGRLVRVQVAEEGKPLVYWRGAYGDVNSRPKSW